MQLSIKYHLPRLAQSAIDFDISICIPDSHKILGVFGESGTGKSTLLKIMAGLVPSANHQLIIHEQHFTSNQHKNIHAKDNPCVYLSSNNALFANLNVKQNLEWICRHGQWRRKPMHPSNLIQMKEIISACKLESLLNRMPHDLSSGEAQRVNFARAVLSGKPILLLDEAFSALDWNTRTLMHSVLIDIVKKHHFYCFLVSHSLEELSLCCSQLIQFKNGAIVRQGDTEQVLQDMHNGLSDLTSAQAFSILEARFERRDEQDASLEMWKLLDDTRQSYLFVKRSDVGDINELRQAKFIVHANKVSIFINKPSATSMLNVFEGTVDSITEHEQGNIVSINLTSPHNNGETAQVLRALITHKSTKEVELVKGQTVFALFKALLQ